MANRTGNYQRLLDLLHVVDPKDACPARSSSQASRDRSPEALAWRRAVEAPYERFSARAHDEWSQREQLVQAAQELQRVPRAFCEAEAWV